MITVLINNQNNLSEINRCLESINDQSYKVSNIILNSIGNFDKNIIKQLEKSGIDVKIRSYSNISESKIINDLIKEINTPFTIFANPNDVWYKNKIESQLNTIKKSEHFGLVYSDFHHKTQNGSLQEIFLPPYDARLLLSHNYLGSSFLLKTKLLENTTLNETLPINESIHEWLHRLSMKCLFKHISEFLFLRSQ